MMVEKYTLRTTANGGGDIITPRDNTNRLSGYFIYNRNLADGHAHAFYLAKVMMSADIIDGDKSSYFTLSGDVRLIDVVVCRSTFDSEFYIARDRDHPAYCVVSEKFVKLCADNNLSIGFADTTQSQATLR